MLLKEGQETLASGSISPLALTPQQKWHFTLAYVTEDDIPELLEITTKAFQDDAMTNGCFEMDADPAIRGEQERTWREERWRKMLRHPDSGQWCLKVVAKNSVADVKQESRRQVVDETFCRQKSNSDERIVGYATWFDNRAESSNAPAKNDTTDPVVQEPDCLDHEAYDAVCKAISKATRRVLQGRKDVWYLESLAVHPDFQRQGVGTKLMRWGVERANVTGCAVFTEASRAGRRLYRKFWLERMKKIRFKSGGFRIAMLRQPIEW